MPNLLKLESATTLKIWWEKTLVDKDRQDIYKLLRRKTGTYFLSVASPIFFILHRVAYRTSD